MKLCCLPLLLSFLSFFGTQLAFAGARGGDLAIVDATEGEHTKVSARLFELFIRDTKEIFRLGEGLGFAWIGGETKVRVVPREEFKGAVAEMITVKNQSLILDIQEKYGVQDGLIVFQYDRKAQKVRLKLFDGYGSERILIKLPLCDDGPMTQSVMKSVRRGAIIALGTSVEFNP